MRQGGGLSGFTKRAESEYDPFGAAHSSTSISAGLGMAVARDLAGDDNNVIAVIGDGAMSAGMAYEAMNNAGALQLAADRHPQRQRHVDRAAGRRHVGLSGAAGAPAAPILKLRDVGKQLAKHLPKFFEARHHARVEECAAAIVTGGTLFEELGFYYVGPIDGHNLDHLLPVLRNVRDAEIGPDPGPCRDARRARAMRRRKPPPTSITASSSSTSPPARRRSPKAARRTTPRCSPRA